MAKQSNVLKQFETLHRQLVEEREQLRQRLAALNNALGDNGSPATAMPVGAARATTARDLGMREAIQQATSAQPLSVREIVDAIQKIGFRFKSKNPYNSVGAYLYGKEGRKYFSKTDGKFSALPAGAASQAGGSRRRGKRTLSAAGRRAIAAAARKRWAQYKAAKSRR